MSPSMQSPSSWANAEACAFVVTQLLRKLKSDLSTLELDKTDEKKYGRASQTRPHEQFGFHTDTQIVTRKMIRQISPKKEKLMLSGK